MTFIRWLLYPKDLAEFLDVNKADDDKDLTAIMRLMRGFLNYVFPVSFSKTISRTSSWEIIILQRAFVIQQVSDHSKPVFNMSGSLSTMISQSAKVGGGGIWAVNGASMLDVCHQSRPTAPCCRRHSCCSIPDSSGRDLSLFNEEWQCCQILQHMCHYISDWIFWLIAFCHCYANSQFHCDCHNAYLLGSVTILNLFVVWHSSANGLCVLASSQYFVISHRFQNICSWHVLFSSHLGPVRQVRRWVEKGTNTKTRWESKSLLGICVCEVFSKVVYFCVWQL